MSSITGYYKCFVFCLVYFLLQIVYKCLSNNLFAFFVFFLLVMPKVLLFCKIVLRFLNLTRYELCAI